MINQIFLSYSLIISIFSLMAFISLSIGEYNKQNKYLQTIAFIWLIAVLIYPVLVIITGLNHIWGWGL